jgi:hypothetical protein
MKTITLSNSVIVMAVLLLFSGCKKDDKPDKEDIKPQKIKSYTPRIQSKPASNANFTYADDGRLHKVDLNTPFLEHDRLDYTYLNEKIRMVAYDVDGSADLSPQRSEIEFVYADDRLSAVNVTSKHGEVPNVSYAFSYSGGPGPSAYTLTISDDKMSAADVKTYTLTSDAKGNITGAEMDLYRTKLEYDTQLNPLYKLPWMDVERRTINYANHSASAMVFVLDVERLFSPNNIKKVERFYEDHKYANEETEYNYTKAGQPHIGYSTLTGQFKATGNTEYLYW